MTNLYLCEDLFSIRGGEPRSEQLSLASGHFKKVFYKAVTCPRQPLVPRLIVLCRFDCIFTPTNVLSNPLLGRFASFLLFFAHKVMLGTYSFVSLIVKIILLESAPLFSTPGEAKKQCFIHLSFSSTLQLISGISCDHQKLLGHFNGTATVAFFRIELFPSAAVVPNNLALYSKDLKAFLFAILALKLVASSLE